MNQQPFNPDPISTMESWQSSVPAPAGPPPNRLKYLLLIGAIILLVLAGVVGLLFSVAANQQNKCFNTADYYELLTMVNGVASGTVSESDLVPDQNLYGVDIWFDQDTPAIDTDLSEDAVSFLKSLGTYYRSSQNTAPVKITIETSYFTADSLQVARYRTDDVKAILTGAGVDESSIVVSDPVPRQPSEESLSDDDVIDGAPVTVGVTPISRCEE